MDILQLRAKITKATRKKDGSISLAVSTVGEVSPEEFLLIDKGLNEAGHLLFSPNPSDPSNIPEEMVEDGQKSQSERLRAVIWHMWNQSGKKVEGMSSDEYYKKVTEIIINNLKGRLDGPKL